MALRLHANIIRTHIPRFLKKVHPDVFASHPDYRSVNQSSLKSLNTMLSRFKTPLEQQISSDLGSEKLNFFCKSRFGSNEKIHQIEATLSDQVDILEGQQLSLRKTLKKLSKISPQKSAILFNDHIVLFLFDIFKKAHVEIDASQMDMIKKRYVNLLKMLSPVPLPETTYKSTQGLFEQELKTMKEEGSLSLSSDERLRETMEDMKDMIRFFSINPRITISEHLLEEEKATAMVNFWEHIDDIDYRSWSQVHVHISRDYLNSPDGLQIPHDFDVQDLKAFLKKVLPTK